MARMKTGRLTKMTTPPDKYIITSKRETVQPRQLTDKEKKYNADMEAGEKYKSDLGTYNKQMAIYNKDEATKLSKGGKDYGYGAGIDKNSRALSPSELSEFNKKRKTADYNPDQPDYAEVRVNTGKNAPKDPTDPSGFHGYYKKPIAPKKPDTPDENDMPIDRLPGIKITSIKSRGRSIIKAKEKPEPVLFDNPNKAAVVKTKYVHDSSGIRTKAKNPKQEAKEGNINDTTTSRNKIGYKKEQRLFKAKASTGAAGTDFTNLDSQDIKYARKNYLKKDLAAARTDATLKPDERAKRIASAKMEIKQSRGAQTYSRKMEKGKLSHFNDENYKGDIIKDYKSSLDNVNNKNTIDAKLKAIGEKAKSRPGSFGNMPTS